MSTDDVLVHIAVRFDSSAQRDEMRMNGDSGPCTSQPTCIEQKNVSSLHDHLFLSRGTVRSAWRIELSSPLLAEGRRA